MQRLSGLLPRSLVGRVFALYTITLVTFVVAGLGLFYHYQLIGTLEYEQQRTEGLSRVITPSVIDAAVIGDYDTIQRTLERTVDQSNLSSASFIDLTGGVVGAKPSSSSKLWAPRWLVDKIAYALYDNNQAIHVGGRDYGVLRLRFDAELIAARLWEQMRFALVLGLVSIVGGLVLIRLPLVRWLGNLSRIQAFEQAMQSGDATPVMLAAESAPSEFRQTFEVLGRAAASLQAERVQASVALSAIADAVLTLNAQGRVVLANPAACLMLGQSAAELRGKPISTMLPDLIPNTEALQPWRDRQSVVAKVPSPSLAINSSLSPILSPERETVGYVLAFRDVSEKHALDQRLRAELSSREAAMVSLRQVLEGLLTRETRPATAHATDDLEAISSMISTLVARMQARGEQLNAIFTLSPDGFASFDAQRRANYVSPAFVQLTGLSEQQLLGATERDIEDLLHRQCSPNAPWRSFEAIRFELRQHPGQDDHNRRERIELVRPVKRVLEVGLHESTSATISQVLSLRDVTHETEVDRMKSEFLSTAAHELRTPMTSIYGFSELMLDRAVNPAQREMIATIHRQSALMISIINELLDLARIEARRGTDFALEDLDLCQLTQELLHDFKPPNGRPLPLSDFPASAMPVRVDRQKMLQAMGNVVSNAYKYSPGDRPVHVRIVRDMEAVPPRVGLEVRDEGMGMTPEQLARVGERFYRADASGTIPGTGLGVSIVKEIIELLGGRMGFESTPGQGSTVTLWLPLLLTRSEASPPGPETHPGEGPGQPRPPTADLERPRLAQKVL